MPSVFEFSTIKFSPVSPLPVTPSSIGESLIVEPINFLIHLIAGLPHSDSLILDSFFIFMLLFYMTIILLIMTIILLIFAYFTQKIRDILSYLYDNNREQQEASLKVEFFYKNIKSKFIKIKKGKIIDVEEYHFKNKSPYYVSFFLNKKHIYFPISKNDFELYSKKNDVYINVTFKKGIKTIINNVDFEKQNVKYNNVIDII